MDTDCREIMERCSDAPQAVATIFLCCFHDNPATLGGRVTETILRVKAVSHLGCHKYARVLYFVQTGRCYIHGGRLLVQAEGLSLLTNVLSIVELFFIQTDVLSIITFENNRNGKVYFCNVFLVSFISVLLSVRRKFKNLNTARCIGGKKVRRK